MRTSILLDDELGRRLREEAKRKGMSLSAFLAEAGREKLGGKRHENIPPFNLVVAGGEGVREGINLDKTSALVAAED